MKYLSLVFALIFLIGCNSEQPSNGKIEKTETPEALQDDKLEIKSYSRSSDLVEELYQELVDKTPELKTLEGELKAYNINKTEVIDGFQNYDNKSISYYSSANDKLAGITDSLLKQKIRLLINQSKDRYSTKKSELTNLIIVLNKNDLSLNDYHLALKITSTFDLIEKYQTDNLPNNKDFKSIISDQFTLTNKLDSLIK